MNTHPPFNSFFFPTVLLRRHVFEASEEPPLPSKKIFGSNKVLQSWLLAFLVCVTGALLLLDGSQDHMVCCLHQQPAEAFRSQLGVRPLARRAVRQAARSFWRNAP